ncbi:hypothetical protein UFOVP828_42 [uncultured Caudovirales phage]|uniref:Tail fiber protein n=1 Tax=uncultured Caudovirales phage TaxID=2100421 RepID=A0A6J5NZR7_9CAUD|nr:hypothetical protein UFOVP828_42 [uncultured Caudovirales phage]
MATVTKNFKIKHGLVVEGTTGTIDGFDILTKSTDNQQYIIDLVGGDAASNAVANTIVLRDGNANFAANTITANLVGDVTGQVSDISNFDSDDLTEGASNLYFTDQRVEDAMAGLYDPAGSAANAYANALSDAEDYADGLATNYDPAGAAANAYSNALSDAEDYTDNAVSNAVTTLETYADLAAGNALANAESYTDNAISNLIANAPALLDTLNEIAAAIGDDANFVGTITNLVAEKQNALIPGTDIDIVGNTISFTGSYDPSGSAANAYSNATAYTDLEIGNAYADLELFANNAAGNALANANSYTDNAIGLLSTSDIEEGTNEYFTDTRARASAATLLTMATLTNISITGNSTGLVITAENGVGDSNTDALVEGTTNLYFTDQRAVDALEAVIPNFTEIDINTVARQVAATVPVATASTVTAIDWALADYRSAEFLVKVAYGAHTEISKVMLTLDTSNNIAITEYAIVGTNGSASTISADVNGTDVRLRVATANNNSDVTVVGTLLA